MQHSNGYVAWKLVAVIFLLGLAAWFASDLFAGPEGKIRKEIKAAAKAVEKEDIYGVLGIVANEYEDATGINYAALLRIGQIAFRKYEDIDIDISNVKIEINGDEAVVTLTAWGEATLAATMGTDQLPVREAFKQQGVRLTFRKSGGKWLLYGSERLPWSVVLGQGTP